MKNKSEYREDELITTFFKHTRVYLKSDPHGQCSVEKFLVDTISEAEFRGASKLANSLLKSKELQLKEVFIPDPSNYDDVAREGADLSENWKVKVIQKEIEELLEEAKDWI